MFGSRRPDVPARPLAALLALVSCTALVAAGTVASPAAPSEPLAAPTEVVVTFDGDGAPDAEDLDLLRSLGVDTGRT